eukprot:3493551-Prymnesium_polylepis.1
MVAAASFCLAPNRLPRRHDALPPLPAAPLWLPRNRRWIIFAAVASCSAEGACTGACTGAGRPLRERKRCWMVLAAASCRAVGCSAVAVGTAAAGQ